MRDVGAPIKLGRNRQAQDPGVIRTNCCYHDIMQYISNGLRSVKVVHLVRTAPPS